MSDADKELANDGRTKFRVWWTPQIPMKPFEVEVGSYAEGKRLEDILGQYDLFQLEHNIKPDYANAGGTSYCHPELTEGEWYDIEEEEAAEYGWTGSGASRP
jgi:hypothetical protein